MCAGSASANVASPKRTVNSPGRGPSPPIGRNGRDPGGSEMSGRRLLDTDDEILRLAEAGGRDPLVLLVCDRHARAHHLAHDGRETVGSNGEGKALLRRAWNVHHGELAFPRLTD